MALSNVINEVHVYTHPKTFSESVYLGRLLFPRRLTICYWYSRENFNFDLKCIVFISFVLLSHSLSFPQLPLLCCCCRAVVCGGAWWVGCLWGQQPRQGTPRVLSENQHLLWLPAMSQQQGRSWLVIMIQKAIAMIQKELQSWRA